tara:strand:+ start:148 stop:390 length:243 start_codon:yes stop_codon:yes gene_type:complete
MNKHIAVVKRWLDNPESVSLEELRATREASDMAMFFAADAAVDSAAYYAAYAAEAAVDTNADVARDAAADWVKRYEELTK